MVAKANGITYEIISGWDIFTKNNKKRTYSRDPHKQETIPCFNIVFKILEFFSIPKKTLILLKKKRLPFFKLAFIEN